MSIKYLSQRDVPLTEGIPGSSDCGYTSCCMLFSFFDPSYGSIEAVSKMVADLEPYKGPESFGNTLVKKFPWAKAIFSKGNRIGSDLRAYVELGRATFPNLKTIHGNPGSWAELDEILAQGFPVLLFTSLSGSGHYILVVSKDDVSYTVKDPWGNAVLGYKNHNGDDVKYPIGFLRAKVGPKPYYFTMR
jgi:hypothetical protein